MTNKASKRGTRYEVIMFQRGQAPASEQPVGTMSKPPEGAKADDPAIDALAHATEQKMTDDERFSLVISLIGALPSLNVPRDRRIAEGVNMSAGYTPGVPRLGVPALQSSDAS